MEPVNRTSQDLRGLVTELDDKLAATRRLQGDAGISIIESPRRRLPGWAGMAIVTILGIALATLIVQPWQERCTYGRDLCAVAELDIDALRITIPNSDLIATLPNIDALDPNDELTAGDIFAMERFAHLNFEELLTDEEIERLLGTSG